MGAGGKRKMCPQSGVMNGGGPGAGGGKMARWEESSLARLQAVAVPGEPWAPPSWGPAPGSPAPPDDRSDCACWRNGARPWSYPQETIRCAENGKSYLELGSGGAGNGAWPRRRCCARQCYRERRLKVMNLCVFKLSRFRQSADPSLRRSVLVCNTLRRMEREAEREAAEEAAREGRMPPVASPGPLRPTAPREPPVPNPGRATPFPSPSSNDTDSGYGEEECTRPIDWGSVLSLSALDPLNNNEPCGGWDTSSVGLDVDLSLTPNVWSGSGMEERSPDGELDNFMHILVGSS